jgi:glycosyltransferase involved in cell wall biosynthesis
MITLLCIRWGSLPILAVQGDRNGPIDSILDEGKMDRITTAGKFFRLAGRKWYVKGFSYGPFAPREDGVHLPTRSRMRCDFAHMRELGANALRVYFPPPLSVLDDALEYGLRVLIDVPWDKHRCFLEDWFAQTEARIRVRGTASTLGNHPAVFAISVVNEIPADVVRFYGHRRVERFIDELLETVKQEAPNCLTTFVNFPTTEFLNASGGDFCCFNVYVHDERKCAAYFDRLQHVAGNKPLLLGEYGIDTMREGEAEQATLLRTHVRQVFRRGLAGSFIFAYTDDWFTGGYQIDDWAFGVTHRDRSEKPSAIALRQVWNKAPHGEPVELPRVSVVVCSYNGATTLPACLQSLVSLNYPDYEVILVDDGSTDETRQIAARFPDVIYQYQENRGLSAARNVGAELASGEIVAYTDSDCVADEDWVWNLVHAMQDQQVEAIGGPNISPESDGWTAKCVAASPGNPSHVMLDDRLAEHVPGCNMAFRCSTLLRVGRFDPQFRQAGDDIDICWRFLDAGLPIGYAPGAMVWHHRRATFRAYVKQQKGYGRAEALVHLKHPQRSAAFGRSRWNGVIYGDGAVGLPLVPQLIYHGRFGGGLFQSIYRHNQLGVCAWLLSLEWHLSALFGLVLATLFWPLVLSSALMWLATSILVIRLAWKAPLPKGAPWWCRPLVAWLYFLQPLLRGWYRLIQLLASMKLPATQGDLSEASPSASPQERSAAPGDADCFAMARNHVPSPSCNAQHQWPGHKYPMVKHVNGTIRDVYWYSDENRGREDLLPALVEHARAVGWHGDFGNPWADWDLRLIGDIWHRIFIRTATESLGWPNRFTRARCVIRWTLFSRAVAVASVIWAGAAALSEKPWAMLVGLFVCLVLLCRIAISQSRCLRAATATVVTAGRLAGLAPERLATETDPRQQAALWPAGAAAGSTTASGPRAAGYSGRMHR